MTLSLDDVRNKRFRMARKSGYEVLEVDEFVDEVEVAFEQLTEENQNLKKQIEALKAAPAAASEGTPAAGDAGPKEPETIVVTTGAEASSAVVRLVTLSTEQAERMVVEATDEAARIREDAATAAHQLTGDAQARAERLTAEAQETAERVQAEARSRADSLDAEIAGRRNDLLGALHSERDELQLAVGRLRGFEAAFRAKLADELREHIASVESRTAQPDEVPPLADPSAIADAEQRAAAPVDSAGDTTPAGGDAETADGEAGSGTASDSVFPDDDPTEGSEETRTSDTPRLDALLGDQR